MEERTDSCSDVQVQSPLEKLAFQSEDETHNASDIFEKFDVTQEIMEKAPNVVSSELAPETLGEENLGEEEVSMADEEFDASFDTLPSEASSGFSVPSLESVLAPPSSKQPTHHRTPSAGRSHQVRLVFDAFTRQRHSSASTHPPGQSTAQLEAMEARIHELKDIVEGGDMTAIPELNSLSEAYLLARKTVKAHKCSTPTRVPVAVGSIPAAPSPRLRDRVMQSRPHADSNPSPELERLRNLVDSLALKLWFENGEVECMKADTVLFVTGVESASAIQQIAGRLFVTQFRLLFLSALAPADKGFDLSGLSSYAHERLASEGEVTDLHSHMHSESVPLTAVSDVSVDEQAKLLEVKTRTVRWVHLAFDSIEKLRTTQELIRNAITEPAKTAFAFSASKFRGRPGSHRLSPPSALGAGNQKDAMSYVQWSYDPVAEYARMGIRGPESSASPATTPLSSLLTQVTISRASPSSSPSQPPSPRPSTYWELSAINRDYALCSSYPQHLAFPCDVNAADIAASAEFRVKQRIPVLSWRNNISGACIVRCAQPHAGLANARCEGDERLVAQMLGERSLGAPPRPMTIVDCRSKAAAMGNAIRVNGGVENPVFYGPRTQLLFMDIQNIHAVRNSYDVLENLCRPGDERRDWYAQLHTSMWVDYLSTIIQAGVTVCRLIEDGSNVLVHCSDGWDRTAQVSSLSQILLDPYYRTFEGLIVLIEKEWIGFGHKFLDRLGYAPMKMTEADNRSPVFVQWCDAVHQVMVQFPQHFEYRPELLACIVDCIFSFRFGNFICNCERERNQDNLHQSTDSMWEYLRSNRSPYLNPIYDGPGTAHVISPSASIRSLVFWRGFFLRWDSPTAALGAGNQATVLDAIALSQMRGGSHDSGGSKLFSRVHNHTHHARLSADFSRQSSPSAQHSADVEALSLLHFERLRLGFSWSTLKYTLCAKPTVSVHAITRLEPRLMVPSRLVKGCAECNTKFSLTTRKHHCRACGSVYCQGCIVGKLPILMFGMTSAVKVCKGCESAVRNSNLQLQSS